MAQQVQDLERRLSLDGPQTDDELHNWITTYIGIDIPRVSVCEHHNSPFEFIADLYFERTTAAIAMAARATSKTANIAILHILLMKFKPKIECMSVGAIQSQADRAYEQFNYFMGILKENDINDADLIRKESARFKNASTLKLAPATYNSVNGPHPQFLHMDEVELVDPPEVYYEALQMPTSKKVDGRTYPAQIAITSTRKRAYGLMQTLIDSINEAKIQGLDPPLDLYAWCIFEAAERQDNCQVAYPNLLEEKDEEGNCKACNCERSASGRWENGQARTLRDVCGGRLAKSAGWIPIETIKNTFKTSNRSIWEAQQECIRPSTEGLVFPQFSLERHGILNFDADPDNGPIYSASDPGGTDPTAVLWFQLLNYDIEVKSTTGVTRKLKAGTIVAFDEFYQADLTGTQVAARMVKKEESWRLKFPRFRVDTRFSDPQGKQFRLELARYKTPMPTIFITTRRVEEQIPIVGYYLENDLFAVDGRCKMFFEEVEYYHYPKKRAGLLDNPDKPVDDFDHIMSCLRYGVCNIQKLKSGHIQNAKPPMSSNKQHITVRGAGSKRQHEIPAWAPTGKVMPASEQWRRNMGNVTRSDGP